ncbi:MAG: hypothetical protein KFF45_09020 [Thioalkalivibrio sp.]|nr:hypothetical protein [Thioalkalivibrio sp.]
MRQDLNPIQRPTRRRVVLLVALLVVLAIGLPVPGKAAPATLEEAVAQVERTHGGRILSARSERRNGEVVYVIRLLTDEQQVRNLEIEGAEGARP